MGVDSLQRQRTRMFALSPNPVRNNGFLVAGEVSESGNRPIINPSPANSRQSECLKQCTNFTRARFFVNN
jgi:hypothetical protein